MESTVRISRVAAGATTIGSHSMAVSTDGSLFGWGVGQLSGLNSTSPVLIPTKITIPPENDENNEDEFLIVDVSCGGGFSVCITKSGRLYSWGVWSHGRLGMHVYIYFFTGCDVIINEIKMFFRSRPYPFNSTGWWWLPQIGLPQEVSPISVATICDTGDRRNRTFRRFKGYAYLMRRRPWIVCPQLWGCSSMGSQ